MSVNLQAIGLSGIAAAENAMAAIESNLSNSSNPSYSVESVGFQTLSGPQGGTGVEVMPTTRAEAPLLTQQIDGTQSSESYSQAFSQIATVAQQIIAPSSGDLSSSLQDVFNSLTSLSANPQDPTTRMTVLSALTNFAQTDRSVSSGLYSTAVNQLNSVSPLITQINQASTQVAQLNGQIISAQASGQSAAPLLDSRDAAINQLASLIGATADANGNVTVGGVPLVSGTSALELSTTGTGTATGPVGLAGERQLPLNLSQIGGQLGGLWLARRDLNLQSQVDNFACTLAIAFNNQSTRIRPGWTTNNALFTMPAAGGRDRDQSYIDGSKTCRHRQPPRESPATVRMQPRWRRWRTMRNCSPLSPSLTPSEAFTQVASSSAPRSRTPATNKRNRPTPCNHSPR